MKRLIPSWSEESADVQIGEILEESETSFTVKDLGVMKQNDFEKFIVNYMRGKGIKSFQIGQSKITLTEGMKGGN